MDEIVNSKVNGQRLFGGRNVDFMMGFRCKHRWNNTQFSSVDVGTTSGTMEISSVPEGHLIYPICSGGIA